MTHPHPPSAHPAPAHPTRGDPTRGDPTRDNPTRNPARNPAHDNPARRWRVPRWGSVAHRRGGSVRLSTAPGGGVVVGAGILFLLARPALGGGRGVVPLLALGYPVLLGGALAVRGNDGDPSAAAPLGWKVPLVLGLVGVAGAAVVAGPVADRRVGGVAVGLALGAAVAEEALFRRVLYERLLRFGVVAAVVGSAGVFALVHLPAYGVAAMPVDLGAALLLSWQRYASGRWTVPAVTHAVANLLAVT
jgi:membrane protease YdiL (CAAX protease family)